MHSTKWLSIITALLTIITLFGICLLWRPKQSSLIYDISLAAFGSSFIALIMSISQYFSARKKALERFLIEVRKVIQDFKKAEYFDAASLIYTSISNKTPLKDEAVKHESAINSCFNSFISIADKRYRDFFDAYGELDFLYGGKLEELIRYELYEPIRKHNENVIINAFHFREYINGERTIEVCLTKLENLNKDWFRVEQKTNHGISTRCVYAEVYDNFVEKTDKLWAMIYHKKEIQMQRRPIKTGISEQ